MGVQSKSTANLTSGIFSTAISKLNESNGVVPRRTLNYTVAIETTIVELLSCLDWDKSGEYIEMITPLTEAPQKHFVGKLTEAADDNVRKRITAELRVRRGQNKLRKNLLELYDGKCCITGFAVADALHACHLIPHAESGWNSSTNALLLRSDIHDLFDAQLIGIEPKTLKIRVKDALFPEYGKYHGRLLAVRKDHVAPNQEALKKRWKLFLHG